MITSTIACGQWRLDDYKYDDALHLLAENYLSKAIASRSDKCASLRRACHFDLYTVSEINISCPGTAVVKKS